jgi:hypothetical protein
MYRTKVWRTMYHIPSAGYFVWDVNECEGVTENELKKYPGAYLPTADNGFIIAPYCHHFWTEAKAVTFLHSNDYPELCEYIIID